MKSISRSILSFQEDIFFSPLRDKIDYALLVIHASRSLLLDLDLHKPNSQTSLKLIIDKMSRLFFFRENKFYSVSFPFHVITWGKKVNKIKTYSGVEVTSKLISSVISILSNEKFINNPSLINFSLGFDDKEEAIEYLAAITLLEEIFLFEPCYIRFEVDEKNANAKLHPLNHFDVNYSSYGTYKIGLNKGIIGAHFEKLLDIKAHCRYLAE